MQIGITLIVFATIAGWVKRDSRVSCILVFAVMWILMGLNCHNDDFVGYQYFYDLKLMDYSGVNYGFLCLEQLCWSLGLNFIQFRMLSSFLGLGLLTLFVRRYSRDPSAVLVLYLLMPFFYDIVQFKFFLAASFAIYGLRFLIDRTRLFLLKYFVFLCAAVLIHPAALLFGFFLIGLLDNKTALKVSLFVALIALFLTVSGLGQVLGYALTDSVKGTAYFSVASRFGWIPYFVSTVGIVAVSHLSYSSMHDDVIGEDNDAPARFEKFFSSAQYAFLPLIAFVPLSVQNFYRPIRSANILFLMHFVSIRFEDSIKMARREKAGLIILALLWIVFTQVILYKGVIDIVLVDELTNNLLWA